MVQDEEVCAALKKIAKLEGLLGGWSSGAAAAASFPPAVAMFRRLDGRDLAPDAETAQRLTRLLDSHE